MHVCLVNKSYCVVISTTFDHLLFCLHVDVYAVFIEICDNHCYKLFEGIETWFPDSGKWKGGVLSSE